MLRFRAQQLFTYILLLVVGCGSWRTPEAAAATNLALGKPVIQSSTSSYGGVASRAVDGITDGNWYASNSVTATASEPQPWWQVDLGAVYSLGELRLWNRTDCCRERAMDVYVFVSDTPFTSTTLTTTLSQAGVSTYRIPGPLGTPTTQAVNRTGRYVRVQLGGTNYLSLAEVQVFEGAGGRTVPLRIASWGGCLGYTTMTLGQTTIFSERGCGPGRGFNVAVVDPATGTLREPVRTFDTWATRGTGAAHDALVTYLNGVPDGSVLGLAVTDEAGLTYWDGEGGAYTRCTMIQRIPAVESVLHTLEALGSTQIRSYCYWDSWAMITVKGQGSSATEQHATRGTSASVESALTLP